jgi:tetratricopeptide (TPR) repeat protein
MRGFRKTALIVVFFFALLGSTASAAQGGSRKHEAALKQVQKTVSEFSADHDTAKAAKGYRRALELDPKCLPAHLGLGVMLEAREDWANARKAFEQVVKIAPSTSLSAAAKLELKRIARIKNLASTPEGRKQRQYDDLLAQARMFVVAGELETAARKAGAAQKLDGGRWEAYAVAGEIAVKSGLIEDAFTFYDAATVRAPKESKAKLKAVTSRMNAEYPPRSDGRFLAYANGTVLDTKTNLMWAAKDNGSDINYRNAEAYCKNYRGGGYTDWRMPTYDELKELSDKTKSRRAQCPRHPRLMYLKTELIEPSCYYVWAYVSEPIVRDGTEMARMFEFKCPEGCNNLSIMSWDFLRALPVRNLRVQ